MSNVSGITHALERVWTAIRTVHKDVRPAMITVHSERRDARGIYYLSSWVVGDGERSDEVHISSTILNEGPESILQTLLHESCHSIATTREIQDVSRQGRYHNTAFAELAKEVGLKVMLNKTMGITTPGIETDTAIQFHNVLLELEKSIDAYQEDVPLVVHRKPKGKTRMLKAVCPGCGRIIRASKKTFNAGNILCQPCLTVFVVERKDQD